jgi:hypothetical protein
MEFEPPGRVPAVPETVWVGQVTVAVSDPVPGLDVNVHVKGKFSDAPAPSVNGLVGLWPSEPVPTVQEPLFESESDTDEIMSEPEFVFITVIVPNVRKLLSMPEL